MGVSLSMRFAYNQKNDFNKKWLWFYFLGWHLDSDPLYTGINELDTINSLLHHKKLVRGSSDIGFVAFA